MRGGLVVAVAATVALAACSGGSGADESSDPAARVDRDEIAIDVSHVLRPFDRRLLGTNIPAWVGPQRLADAAFQQLAVASGTTVIRMPGGSWSTSYDWLACENGDATGCHWTWASRPSDFLGFMAATGTEGMWTLPLNGTAQEAAALVAFFNGDVGDTRVIGTDRRGKDWGTVGQWAALRAEHGHPDPQPVRLWEVGNEVFAAKRDTGGSNCAEFGWEDVWTCDGTEYIDGDDDHDGFLAFRTAMQAVDPTVAVGAVGVWPPGEWTDFGSKVIDASAGQLDFYVLHDYGFSEDEDAERILEQPQRRWPDPIDAVRPALDAAGESAVPIAVTEYNWISSIDADTDAKLIKVVNALYIADVIGQMAVGGVGLANQWNFANGATQTGADYGMVDVDTGARHPQYFALAMWAGIGTDLVRVSSGFDDEETLSTYAATSADGSISVLAINKTDHAVDARLRLDGASGSYDVTANVAGASAVDATSMSYNGQADPPVDLTQVAPLQVGTATGTFTYAFEPYSITVLHLTPA